MSNFDIIFKYLIFSPKLIIIGKDEKERTFRINSLSFSIKVFNFE